MIIKGTWLSIAVILLLSSCNCAQALELEEFVDFITNTGTFDGVDDIEYSPSEYTLDEDWQKTGKIKCWVDIVGYKEMVRYGDQFYIGGSPQDLVDVLYEADDLVATGIGSGWSVTSHKTNIHSISATDVSVTVTVKSVLKYKHTSYNLEGDPPKLKKKVRRHTQVSFFSDTTSFVPMQYPSSEDYTSHVYIYNNSIKPKTICSLNVGGLDIGATFRYKNETVSYQKYHFAEASTMDKNYPYGNLTLLDQWSGVSTDNELMYHFIDDVWIPGANFSVEDLNISVHTPYDQCYVEHDVTQIDGFNNEINWFDILSILFYVVLTYCLCTFAYALFLK